MSATTRSCTLLGEVTTAGLHAGQGDPRPLLLDLAKLCRRVPTILCTSSRIHNERRFRSSFGGLGFGGSSVLPRLGVAPRFFAHALTLGLTTSNCTVHVARRVESTRTRRRDVYVWTRETVKRCPGSMPGSGGFSTQPTRHAHSSQQTKNRPRTGPKQPKQGRAVGRQRCPLRVAHGQEQHQPATRAGQRDTRRAGAGKAPHLRAAHGQQQPRARAREWDKSPPPV